MKIRDGESLNTDREIYRGPDEGYGSFYADSIHVTASGAIGFNVGGRVIVMPLRDWFLLAVEQDGRDINGLKERIARTLNPRPFKLSPEGGYAALDSGSFSERVEARAAAASLMEIPSVKAYQEPGSPALNTTSNEEAVVP